jgi:hypothetical protein
LSAKALAVNSLFAALPQIEVEVPQIVRNWAAHQPAIPQTAEILGAT